MKTKELLDFYQNKKECRNLENKIVASHKRTIHINEVYNYKPSLICKNIIQFPKSLFIHYDYESDLWGTCCLLSWGVCTYFGEWEGGELYYPNQDVTINVKPGDLVIHGALSDCMHGVKEITSGTRYTFSNFSIQADKNPGSFYNYKTPEYYEAIKDLGNWLGPIKENPNVLKMEQLIYSKE